jgi:hypothetical protein
VSSLGRTVSIPRELPCCVGSFLLVGVGHWSKLAHLAVQVEDVVARIDRPDTDVAGRVVVRPHEGRYFEHMLCVLAEPIAVGRWEVLEWPLDETDDGDVGLVARLCKHLELSGVDLFMAEGRVRRQLEEPYVKRSLREVGWELLERGAISGDEVRRIVTREAEAEVGKASTDATSEDGARAFSLLQARAPSMEGA